jgi:hypothetical protein
MLRIPHIIGNRLTDDDQVVSLTSPPDFTPQKRLLVFISVGRWVNPWAVVRLEGLGKLKKKSMTSTGIRNLWACYSASTNYASAI